MRFIKFLPALLVVGAISFSACQKEVDGDAGGTPNPGPGAPTAAQKVLDTALDVAREFYLWYDQIPASVNARSFADPNKLMEAIRAYSMEPGFTAPVDRWSFAMKQSEWDDVSSGVGGDFGFNVFFLQQGDLRVTSVEKNSPAGLAGVKRGWQITKINGNTNITTTNADFIVQAVWGSTNSSFTFKKPDGASVDVTLAAATYQQNPVFLDSVYTVGAKKVGYLVFNSFLGDTNQIYNTFNRVFSRFNQEAVNEVVIDLRYNGGGYVSVQDKLANYLVKPSANGQVLMKQQFNKNLAYLNSTTNVSKIGTLDLSRIFFIVSSSTASASELLINNLKSYMDVKVVGPEPTYGKPVGYFPWPVGDWYVFPVSFRSTNKDGSGNYFNGIQTDKEVADGINKDWGDQTEASLAVILKFIGTGSFGVVGELPGTRAGGGKDSQVREINLKFDAPRFKGAIDTRKPL